MRYRSNPLYVLPFASLSLPFFLGGLVLLYLGAGPQQMTGAIMERFCLLLGALFCGGCGLALVRVALRDFYREITLGESCIFLRKFGWSHSLQWNQLKLISVTDSTLTLTTTTHHEIEVGADVIGFEEFKTLVCERYEKEKQRR